jgi:hypothetical protein
MTSPWHRTPLWALMMIGHGCRSLRGIVLLWHQALTGEMSQLPAVEARKVTVGSLLWWPDCILLWRWGRSAVELLLLLLLLRLLLLKLPRLELWVIAPILLLLWSTQLTPGGIYTMRYLGGAPLELPLAVDPGIILFLFFSSASAMAFIILSWSMAALANSLYDKLERCTRCSYRWTVSPA